MAETQNKKQEIDSTQEKKEILNAYRGLLRASKDARTPEKTRMIRKAYDVALEAHKDTRRKSGEPYIYHPIAVARICAEEMALGATAIAAALLHDTVEDTHLTLNDIENLFDPTVRRIIEGLTKIPEVFDNSTSLQAENFRKLLLTISDDLRVILIKLADRLHNMRTLESMRQNKQLKIASETQYLYAPLAHRLGLYSVKTELDDLAFRFKETDIYDEIEHKLQKSKDVRNRFIRQFSHPIREELNKEGYNFQIKARTKSISSIYRKMSIKNIPFEEVYDLFAIRIIVDSNMDNEKVDCWRIYSIVTDFYQPNPDRLRDWISTPKANGYESLHATVMSPTGKWVEVQIRSERMDEIAEKGFAAHWKYKENNSDDTKFERWLGEIQDLLSHSEDDAIDFMDEFKLNLFDDEIYVFTPKGELQTLPTGGTTLDFAFDIHTDIGLQCIGGKVNNRLVPLSYQLKSGDQVEIITSKKQKPNEDWLRFVVTARAKQKIKSALKDEQKKISSDGKDTLYRKMKQFKIKQKPENLDKILKFYAFKDTTKFYYQIAKGKIDLSKIRELEVVGGMIQEEQNKKPNKDQFKEIIKDVDLKKDTIIIGEGFKNIDYKLSKCCNPIPGDNIFGFISINDGVKIHQTSCPNATQLMSNYAYRIINARWKKERREERITGIKIKGIDDMGIVNDITTIVSKQHNVNIKSIEFETNDNFFEGTIMLYVYDAEHLMQLIEKIEQIEGVRSVERIDK